MKQQQPLPTILNGNELVCELHPKLIDSVGDTVRNRLEAGCSIHPLIFGSLLWYKQEFATCQSIKS